VASNNAEGLGEAVMPRVIDVKLVKISCQKNGFGGSLQVRGDILGQTFNADPTDPTVHQNAVDTKDIFPFLSGPISVAVGEEVPVRMDDSVSFALSTAPDLEPVGLSPPFLLISVRLDGIGRNVLLIKQNTIQSVGVDMPFDVTVESDNVKATLGFSLKGQQPF
jgi:hypothetical protein